MPVRCLNFETVVPWPPLKPLGLTNDMHEGVQRQWLI